MSGPSARNRQLRQRPAAASPSLGWPQVTSLVLAVAGLLDSAYQAYTKLSGTGLAGCSAKTDACVLVQNSSQAYIFGIPMAVFGLVFYLFMTESARRLRGGRRRRWSTGHASPAR